MKNILPTIVRIQFAMSLRTNASHTVEYGLEVCRNARTINQIRKLQKWALRSASGGKFSCHTSPIMRSNNVPSLNDLNAWTWSVT